MNKDKLDIIKWVVNENDPDMLRRIHEMIADIDYERTSDTKMIGYNMNETKIYKSRFVQAIRQSEAGVENGEFLSLDELERQSENW